MSDSKKLSAQETIQVSQSVNILSSVESHRQNMEHLRAKVETGVNQSRRMPYTWFDYNFSSRIFISSVHIPLGNTNFESAKDEQKFVLFSNDFRFVCYTILSSKM